MKKILIILAAAMMFSCTNNNGYKLDIQIPELANSKISLAKVDGRELAAIDSVVLDSLGHGEMSGTVESAEMMYVGQIETRNLLPVFMDNQTYTVKGNPSQPDITADAGPQLDFNKYNEEVKQFIERQQEIRTMYGMASQSGAPEDSLKALSEAFMAINDEKANFESDYIKKNTTSAVSLYLMRSNFYQYDLTELEEKLSSIDESLHSNTYYTFLNEHLEKLQSVAIGKKFVDFELPDVDGNPYKLSQSVGNGVLLVDFWASWCGPCRMANPGVVKVYNEFHEKGFDILGVSLDKSKDEWLEAIAKDSLDWKHISDLKFWDSKAAEVWAIKSIPSTVLIDKEGTIIAKNLTEEELKEKLQELLGE